jgi:Alpha-glutamyl/putrescinyl thymine pyrophosphorylase clade 3
VRPGDHAEALRIGKQLTTYEAQVGTLPGISSRAARATLVEQLIESERRNRYVKVLLSRELGDLTEDPTYSVFDPLRAAIINFRRGNHEEAFWMIFLFVHFGRHRRGGWRYAREVYGKLGQGGRWDWDSVRSDVGGFRTWLDDNRNLIRQADVPGGFGNHRKYESLGGWSSAGTGAVVSSYVEWVEGAGGHDALFENAIARAAGDEQLAFDYLYRAMGSVHRFGRTARFDYLSMIAKTEFAKIRPGKAYISGATGPRTGAMLLFGQPDSVDASELEAKLQELEEYLAVGFDVIEDALCNWQKSPAFFRPFRG